MRAYLLGGGRAQIQVSFLRSCLLCVLEQALSLTTLVLVLLFSWDLPLAPSPLALPLWGIAGWSPVKLRSEP